MPVSVFFTGGTRSGKSAFAQRWAEAQAPQRVYIATARIEDEETRLRVQQHQAARGQGWHTVEEPLDLVGALERGAQCGGVLLVDCVTMWVSNCMAANDETARIVRQASAVAAWLEGSAVPVGLVSAELGMGLVPMTPLGRAFRDVHGAVNQCLARACTDACLLVAGLPLILKGTNVKEGVCASFV